MKMITGDQMAIAKETARRLGMGFNIFTPEQLENAGQFHVSTTQLIEEADGFAQGRVRECGKGIECNAEEVWQGVSGGAGGRCECESAAVAICFHLCPSCGSVTLSLSLSSA